LGILTKTKLIKIVKPQQRVGHSTLFTLRLKKRLNQVATVPGACCCTDVSPSLLNCSRLLFSASR